MSTHCITRSLLFVSISAAMVAHAEVEPATKKPDEILVVATRDNRISKGAIGLDLELKETPQSISVVRREQIDNFAAASLNDALRLATGISVEEWETNRTNYLARGFEIKNTQIDGVGLPNNWGIATGAMDSFGYEKLEVIRGANGLLTGVGNAAGTLNFVRKRPTNTAQGSVELTAGEYDLRRLEADYSTPFTSDGSWAGRFVAVTEDKESHLRDMTNDRTYLYGVIDGQLGENSTIAAGYAYQVAHTDSNMWGALVLATTDGTQAEYDTDASTAQNWAYWDTVNQNAFVEYTQLLARDWQLKASYNYREFEDDDQLFFAYSTTGIDKETGLGLYGWPYAGSGDVKSNLFDLNVTGDFSLLGREHEAVLGVSHSSEKNNQDWRPVDYSEPAFGALPAFPYSGDVIPEPDWGVKTHYSTANTDLTRFYGTTRLSLTERLTAVLGVNAMRFQRDGDDQGVDFDQEEDEISPYAGVTFDITRNALIYASYSDIYQPQDQQDIGGSYLEPTKGVNYEVGVKAEWFERRLLGTLALFSAEQEALATYAGLDPVTGMYYYEGMDIKSEGIETELSGRINEYMDIVLGFTALQLKDDDGENTYKWVPRRTANLAITSKLPFNTDISAGLSGKWQSDISTVDSYTNVKIRQDAYLTLNAFVRWKFTDKLHASLNINNLTDEKYLTSLYQVGYYAAPRNSSVSLGYTF